MSINGTMYVMKHCQMNVDWTPMGQNIEITLCQFALVQLMDKMEPGPGHRTLYQQILYPSLYPVKSTFCLMGV